ncbi:NUDIX domain-containing protein [Streptomyces avermitilis]|uniref:NUDIX domain-containing protein n=1 Tax=Streptomyces avermitilis TaxID=33903 RepID=UPI0036CF8466
MTVTDTLTANAETPPPPPPATLGFQGKHGKNPLAETGLRTMCGRFRTGPVPARPHGAPPALIVVAVATGAGRLSMALASNAETRVTPLLTTEADVALVAAVCRVEAAACGEEGFADRQEAAEAGVTRTTTMVDDARRFMAAAVRMVAAGGVFTVLHWITLRALLLSVLPAGIGAPFRARTDSALAPGQLTVVGGHLQVGEPLDPAARRAAEEETGVRITPFQQELRGILHHHDPDGMDRITDVFVAHSSSRALNRPAQGGAL